MSEKNTTASQPPYKIVATMGGGAATRVDGTQLKSASHNPWYVLATVYGEQSGDEVDWELHTKNQRIWNGWTCKELDDEERSRLAEKLELPEEQLKPLSADEVSQARHALISRLPAGVRDAVRLVGDYLPNPSELCDFGEVYFLNPLVLEKYIFNGAASFDSSNFKAEANFSAAVFLTDVSFQKVGFGARATFDRAVFEGEADFSRTGFDRSAYFRNTAFKEDAFFFQTHFIVYAMFNSASFSREGNFSSTIFGFDTSFEESAFGGHSSFVNAKFSDIVRFGSASFNEGIWFRSALFAGQAWFENSTFKGDAWFSDGAFENSTSFKNVSFVGYVPTFYQRQMHQDTIFTTAPANWPKVTTDNAEESKQAYTRLRQIMLELEKPDEAHFFYRQEMRCKAELETGLARWVNKTFGLISDYGHSLNRPIWGLGGVWLAAALIYSGSFYVSCHVWHTQCTGIATPFGLSFTSLFSFLGLNRLFFADVLKDLPGALMALAGVQTIAGFVLLFFLGLALRNHFRLK